MSTRRQRVMLRLERFVMSPWSTERTLEPRSHPWLVGAVLLGAALVGLWLAHQVASTARDPAAWSVMLVVAVVSALAISAFGAAVFLIITESQSRAYRVFCSRHAVAATLFTVALGSALAVPSLRRDLFHHVLSTGIITGETIVDFVLVLAVASSIIGAIAGVFGTVDAIREERSWGASLSMPDPHSRLRNS